MEIKDLLDISAHSYTKTKTGALVLVLNTGSVVTAEDSAMLMSLHSRSPGGIMSHLQKLAKSGSGKLMQNFYVGYGHKSIGDCGSTNIFIENISMLAAKAIQDHMLYNGQECSTRYIDYSNQPFLIPSDFHDNISEVISISTLLFKMREFYINSLPKVVAWVAKNNPIQKGEDDVLYKKAVNARAFDILRGYLPAGAATNIAWHTNLRQVADRLLYLRNHPLEEVKEIAEALEKVLRIAHPNSFEHKRYPETEKYVRSFMDNEYIFAPPAGEFLGKVQLTHDGINRDLLKSFEDLMDCRPPKTELPKILASAGTMQFEFLLDFGSYRDIQRQRAVVQRMPILSTRYGFCDWYKCHLPIEIMLIGEELLEHVEHLIGNLNDSNLEKQYLIPMGYLVPCQITGDISALTYLVELRATKFVHPTLQHVAQEMANIMCDRFKLKFYINKDDISRFDVNRGRQDIVER